MEFSHPPSLQLLFAAEPNLDGLESVLRAYHPETSNAVVEWLPLDAVELSRDGPSATRLGRITWGEHGVTLAAFSAAMPATAIDACLRAALLPEEVKADARAHQSHVLLYYAGADSRPLAQLVALAATAGALAEFGAIVTLNEEARAAILSTDLLPDRPGEDMMAVLRGLPVPYLYGGFAKMVLSDRGAIWMRTFANPRLGLPNFAYHAAGHSEGQATFQLFTALAGYLLESGATFAAGESLRLDDAVYTLRAPEASEWWLDGPGPMWVVEAARANPDVIDARGNLD